MMTQENLDQPLQHAADVILDAAKQQGADQSEVSGYCHRGLMVTVRLGELETIEHENDRHLGVSVYFGKALGSASTNDFSDESLKNVVDKACSMAKYTAEDTANGLADAERLARQRPELDLNHPWDIDPYQATDLAIECEQAGRDFDTRISNSEGATVSSGQSTTIYANSNNFAATFNKTRHSVVCSFLAETDGQMTRDFWYQESRDAKDIGDIKEVGRMAAQRTVDSLGAQKISTRKTPVLYPAYQARSLFRMLLSAISGGAQYRKTSFLLDAKGQRIFPEFVQIEEQPHILKAIGSRPMDSEGVATQDKMLIADGVLQDYLLSSYSARRLGLATTGNAGGISNLIVQPTAGGYDELVKKLNTGFIVTSTMGHGFNVVTGDYSYGARGFWVENGDIQHAVNEVSIASNAADMFKGIVAIGSDVDTRGQIRTGSVLINEMTLAGS